MRIFGFKLMLTLLFIITLVASGASMKDSASARPSSPLDSIKPRSLCTALEQVVWSCETARQGKLASICSSKELDKSRGYVQYRFGRPGQVELEFPKERVGTQSAFKYSRYTRALVTYLKLEFVNSGFTYIVSDDSNSEEKPARRDAGISVEPIGTDIKPVTMRCRKPITGSLMTLEDVVQKIETP